MRRIIFARSFDADFFQVSAYVEDQFGIAAAAEFEGQLSVVALRLASSPLIGTQGHGYATKLYGFVLYPNWIFYRFTDDEITLLHIRSSRMNKTLQQFEE